MSVPYVEFQHDISKNVVYVRLCKGLSESVIPHDLILEGQMPVSTGFTTRPDTTVMGILSRVNLQLIGMTGPIEHETTLVFFIWPEVHKSIF